MMTPTIESLLIKAKPAVASTGTLDELMLQYLGHGTASRGVFNRYLESYMDGTVKGAISSWESMSAFMGYMYYLQRNGHNTFTMAGCTPEESIQITAAFDLLKAKLHALATTNQPRTITRQLYDKIAQHDF